MDYPTGKITEVALLQGEKKCSVNLTEGGTTTVYVKEKVKNLYDGAKPGVWVKLKPKDKSKGYFLNAILPGPPQAEQSAPQHRVLEGAELAAKIKERVGMAKYACSLLENNNLDWLPIDIQALSCPNAPLEELDKLGKAATIKKRCEAIGWTAKQAETAGLIPRMIDIIKIIIDL